MAETEKQALIRQYAADARAGGSDLSARRADLGWCLGAGAARRRAVRAATDALIASPPRGRCASAMSDLFRPRRRPLLRLALALGVGAIVMFATVTVIWLRTHVVPPDCEDRATLALVRRSLTERF